MDDPANPGHAQQGCIDPSLKFQWLSAFYDKTSCFLRFWTGSLFVISTTQLADQPASHLFKHGSAGSVQPNIHNWKTAGHGLVVLKELSIMGGPKKKKVQELHNFPES